MAYTVMIDAGHGEKIRELFTRREEKKMIR